MFEDYLSIEKMIHDTINFSFFNWSSQFRAQRDRFFYLEIYTMFLLKGKKKGNKLEDTAHVGCGHILRKENTEEGNREDINSMQMKKARQRENS